MCVAVCAYIRTYLCAYVAESDVYPHRKADVTLTDIDSLTPLMVAAQAGHVEAFNFLLNKNSAIDETDDEGRTVIHLAAKENRVEVLTVQYDLLF